MKWWTQTVKQALAFVALFLLGSMLLVAITGRGCVASAQERIAKQAPGVKKTLAAARRAADDLEQRGPLDSEGVEVDGDGIVLGAQDEGANAAVVYEEELRELGVLREIYARLSPQTLGLTTCAALVEHGTDPLDPLHSSGSESLTRIDVDTPLIACSRLRYLFVIRTVEFAKPRAFELPGTASAAASSAAASPSAAPSAAPPAAPAHEVTRASQCSDGCTFAGGSLKAEVHVYSLDPVQHLGAFFVTAASSDSVVLTASTQGTAAETDLAHNQKSAFDKALARHVPKAYVRAL